MKRKKDLPMAAAEMTHTAAERSAELYDAAKTKLTPLIDQGKTQLDVAKKQGARMAADGIEKAQPAIDDVFTKVQNDLLPKLTDALRQIAEIDQVPLSKRQIRRAEKSAVKLTAQAQKNTDKALRLAKKDLKPRRSAGKTIGTLAVTAALIAGAVALLRRYLASNNDSGWAAHEPSTAYDADRKDFKSKLDDAKRTATAAAEDLKHKAADVKDKVTDKADELRHQAKNTADKAADKATDLGHKAADKAEDLGKKAADKIDEGTDAAHDVYVDASRKAESSPLAKAVVTKGDGSVTGDGHDTITVSEVDSKYGVGSYEGTNPPDGYVIKGNARSMKYHVSGTGGYERTIADVWFNSEEAASTAGFTRAQR